MSKFLKKAADMFVKINYCIARSEVYLQEHGERK